MAGYVNPGLPLPADVLPYSISTGITSGGPAEISAYLLSLRQQGFCCIDNAIPRHELAEVRRSVLEGQRRIKDALPHGTWRVVGPTAAVDGDVSPIRACCGSCASVLAREC